MTRRWEVLDSVPTSTGPLELRRRGEREFLITVAGRVLMNSHANRSELALGRLACQALENAPAPRVLLGGLGMACTLRACLDVLPARAQIVVAELQQAVVGWCREGPLAELTQHAVRDSRVRLEVGDVADAIGRAARPGAERFDAILLDLYEGPPPDCPRDHPQYGTAALGRAREALVDGGVFAIWAEDPSPGFETSLAQAGFRVRRERPGRGGRRHIVYLARNTRQGVS
ncbi:spermidine synthase [Myxococcota bacterium]|nr:spermidine synthase [Myxococcota bacterium]MCZ7618238.1 spermidine synthase [Myxococcota bacterium]